MKKKIIPNFSISGARNGKCLSPVLRIHGQIVQESSDQCLVWHSPGTCFYLSLLPPCKIIQLIHLNFKRNDNRDGLDEILVLAVVNYLQLLPAHRRSCADQISPTNG